MTPQIAEKLIKEARQWLGTPFHHQGRKRGGGCDCIGFVMGVLSAAGLHSRFENKCGQAHPFERFDVFGYAPDPNSQFLQKAMAEHFDEIDPQTAQAGDILLFRILKLPQHVGFVANHPMGGLSLIHAYAPARRVVEERLTENWRARIIGAFRVPPQCYEVKTWQQ